MIEDLATCTLYKILTDIINDLTKCTLYKLLMDIIDDFNLQISRREYSSYREKALLTASLDRAPKCGASNYNWNSIIFTIR